MCDLNHTDSPVDIEWQKAGQTITQQTLRDDSYLQAKSSDKKYTCIVRNAAGEARKTFDLKVLVPPSINELSSSESLQNVIPGSRLSLDCIVDGDPFPEISWTRDDVPIEDGESYKIINQKETVVITKVDGQSAGKYTCHASNKAGNATRDFVVRLTEMPRFLDMSNVNPSIIIGRPLILDCSVSGTPKPTITWMKVCIFSKADSSDRGSK
ncbi:unnamed protein product [Strongylus vulgaris]|uniref:Ig-like domain-containing protein n=1 Tax=Strongylus vulgaris TaxID=40348 RepID=A0A3P7L6Y8_STRVU|nr:unnamed protein product [Strongylus vulgaris]